MLGYLLPWKNPGIQGDLPSPNNFLAEVKRQLCIFRTLPFLKNGELGKRAFGPSLFRIIFREWFYDPSAQAALPGTWNLRLLPREKSLGPFCPSVASKRCHCPLYMLGLLSFMWNKLFSSSLELWGSNKLLFSRVWIHDAAFPWSWKKNWLCPDAQK